PEITRWRPWSFGWVTRRGCKTRVWKALGFVFIGSGGPFRQKRPFASIDWVLPRSRDLPDRLDCQFVVFAACAFIMRIGCGHHEITFFGWITTAHFPSVLADRQNSRPDRSSRQPI